MPVLLQKRAAFVNLGHVSHRSGGVSARTTARGDSQAAYATAGAEQSSMCLFDHRTASCKRSDAEELPQQDTLFLNMEASQVYSHDHG